MRKEDRHFSKLKAEFISGKELSIYDIESILDIKRSRANDYVRTLKSEKFIEKSATRNKIVFYKLSRSYTDISAYSSIKSDDLYRFLILICLSKPLTRKELYEKIFENEHDISSLPISSFYNIVNRMISEGILSTKLYKSKDNNGRNNQSLKLFPSGTKYPLILDIDTTEIATLNLKLSTGMLHGDSLKKVYKKISLASGINDESEATDSIFLQYGVGYSMDKEIGSYYSTLLKNRFTTNVIQFLYRNKQMTFSTGLAVYSQDKDMLYLIGHKTGTKGGTKQVVKCSDITNLTCIDKPNIEYNRSEYLDYLKNMFSITADKKTEYVEIHFDYTDEAYIRLRRLCEIRENATVRRHTNIIIYTDYISGLQDFAVFLRSFTYKYTIISPQSLKDELNETRIKTLNLYK